MNLFRKKEKTPAQTVIEDVCKIKKSEKVLIIANPETSVIAQNLFTSALDSGAKPTLIYQTKKTSADFAEETVVGAIKSEPDVIFSISEIKLGKDEKQGNDISLSYGDGELVGISENATSRIAENNEEYFIETYISGKSDVSTAYLGKCGAERAEAIAMRFAKGALRPVHLEDALCDIAF